MNNLKKSKIIRFKKEEIHEIMELYSKKKKGLFYIFKASVKNVNYTGEIYQIIIF